MSTTIAIKSLPTHESFTKGAEYLERIADAICDIQPEIWEIIMEFKSALEEKDRIQRINTDLNSPDKYYVNNDLTTKQNDEIDVNNVVEYYRTQLLCQLKVLCRERGIQLKGTKADLMTKLVAYSYYGMKLKIQKGQPDIYAAIQYAPQKMYDAAVKCEFAAHQTKHRNQLLFGVFLHKCWYRERTHLTGLGPQAPSYTRKYNGHMLPHFSQIKKLFPGDWRLV